MDKLTSAAESFPAHSSQHVQAEVAVCRLVEVLQSPQVSPVVANILKINLENIFLNNLLKNKVPKTKIVCFLRSVRMMMFLDKKCHLPQNYPAAS